MPPCSARRGRRLRAGGLRALLGGETAEMPDVYAPGDFDMAGFAVGVVELNRMIDGSNVEPGDVILGLASTGIHSNGYSLVRAVWCRKPGSTCSRFTPTSTWKTAAAWLGQVLLTPTRIYAKSIISGVEPLQGQTSRHRYMANVTGSGLPGNVPRMLGDRFNARIDPKTWQVPPIFQFLQETWLDRGKGNVRRASTWASASS